MVSFASGADFDTFPTHGIDGSDSHFCYESPTQDTRLQLARPPCGEFTDAEDRGNQRFADPGMEPSSSSRAQHAEYIRSRIALWTKIAKAPGMKPQ